MTTTDPAVDPDYAYPEYSDGYYDDNDDYPEYKEFEADVPKISVLKHKGNFHIIISINLHNIVSYFRMLRSKARL